MSHFAFICVPAAGHVAPIAAVALELARRGHTATFLHHREVAALIQPYGLAFQPIAAADPAEDGVLAAAIARAGQVRGVAGLGAVMRDFAYGTQLLCERLPDALRALKADCIVADWYEPAAGLVAHRLRLPHVSVAAALPMNWSPGDTSPFVGWQHGTGHAHRWASIAAQWVAERVQRPNRAIIRAYAARWDLGADKNRVEDWASSFAQISQLTASLDFPRHRLIGCFHHCGPLRPPAPPVRMPQISKAQFTTSQFGIAPPRKGRRRAFASLGSLQGHRANVFEWIADSAEALDLELTIAHGGRLGEADAARLSRRATVHAFVDYAAALRACDVAIMHGGLNGTLDALAQGVPLVVVPLAYEQGAIAARVRQAGAGRIVRPLAGGGRLAAAIADVLGDPAYRQAAARVASDIAAAGGARLAADIVEQVARTRAPCLNAAAIAAEPTLARLALGAA